MTSLAPQRREVLSGLAWRAVDDGLMRISSFGQLDAAGAVKLASTAESWLLENGASFVTLHRFGELRGCIGTTKAYQCIGQDVLDHAFAAAFRDPRFLPLRPDERHGLTIELSVLGPATEVPATTRSELLSHLRPGIDGLILQAGSNLATFLPSVWAGLPDPEAFVFALQRKAGITPTSWPSTTRASTYEVEKWQAPQPRSVR